MLNEVNGIINNSLFLIHTCEPEGFPNVFLQAWGLGKPTVSLFYDPDDMIKNNLLGYHAKSFDNLIHLTRNLIADKELRDKMGNNARNFSQKFKPEINIKYLEILLTKIVYGKT